ncbi:MAG: hypothetical protein ACKOXP_10465 [Flavobacteriales bacterium]
MKNALIYSFTLFSSSLLFGQKSELFIPKDAVTVFSINNINLLQKISMDDLVKYEFMEEVHQELFDGSTSGKTLKDAGIDFDQRLNLFYGKTYQNEISGFTFGVKNKAQLFEVFDDFQQLDMKFPGVEMYGTFFNNLIIKGNTAILVRIEPTMEYIDQMTDSLWYARGNEMPYELFDDYQDEEEEVLNEEEFVDEPTDQVSFPDATEDPNIKNYYELRDSVQSVLQERELERLMKELFVDQVNLFSTDARFAGQMTHEAVGTFYLDNSRNFEKSQGLWYFQTVLPSLYQDIHELYTGNVILGDLILKDNVVEFQVEANYGKELGSIYKEMNDAKFDKNVLKYIPESSTAYFTYNVNLRQAYEQAYKVIMPILSDEKNAQISMNVLTIELLNEFVNKDALFGTYKGSMFGTFNGIKKIKTKKIEFYYDEETFEYGERETEAEEDMPIFTVGFSIDRSDIPEKVMNHLSRLTSKFKNCGGYWKFDNAILDAAPLYLINRNGLFILTNDEDLAVNHSNGYGSDALSRKECKAAQKSGFMYSHIDIAETLNRFPSGVLNPRQEEIVQSLKGKSGKFDLTSSKTTNEQTKFNLQYSFTGDETTGKHLLDLINSLYVVTTFNP